MKDCEKFNVESDISNGFEVIQPFVEARSQFGYTLCDEKSIYVVGGMSNLKKSGCIDSIEKYDIDRDVWTLLNVRLPLRLCGVSCIYYEDEKKIKIFGGSDSTKKSTRLVFEMELESTTGKLRECNVMIKKRQMNNKAFMKDGKLYLVGGSVENDCETWRQFLTDDEMIMEKSSFSYEDIMSGDLTNFSGFLI